MEIAQSRPLKEPPGRILAICAGDRSGRPKNEVGQGQLTKNLGLNGDADALKGRLYLLAERDFLGLKAKTPDLAYGSAGENLIVTLNLGDEAIGQRLRSGDALIELTRRAGPLYEAKVILNGIITVGDQIYLE
jgi:MOSC domain-containing protein YiiM